MAIGNAIGSNLFNVFFVLGCTASITPLHLTGITNIDLLMLIFSSLLLWIVAFFIRKRTITRLEGGFMVACFVAYTIYLILQQ